MAHHAYFYAGDIAQGKAAALRYGLDTLGLPEHGSPDVLLLSYGLFSVEDARRVGTFAAQAAIGGGHKLIVIAASRIFHEAQNAMLKLFEEPSPGTVLVLVVPSEGILIPTLRSRLLQLPVFPRSDLGNTSSQGRTLDALVAGFLSTDATGRLKLVAKLVDRSKSDKDEEKQAARLEALQLAEGLAVVIHAKWLAAPDRADYQALLCDLNRFIPILHERSAPLKLIFEHLLLTLPKDTG